MKNKELVILLHGMAQPKLSMAWLARFLRDGGYDTHNIGYRSCNNTHDDLISCVKDRISEVGDHYDRIHIVTHSLGGIITRDLLSQFKPDNLGRVVMLAPPHGGSEVADRLKDVTLYKKIFGITGQQLTTTFQKAATAQIKIDYDLGIIAGTSILSHPYFSHLFTSAHDGLVSVESTKLNGMKDHIVIDATHTFIMNNRKARKQTLNFLKNGQFQR